MDELKEIKQCLTDMLGWLHRLCQDNGLRYYIAGGTLLGAVRHQGFIPWDDDVDVSMPRSDLRRLEQIIADGAGGGRYALETPNSPAKDFLYTYSKLYDTGTTLIEKNRVNVRRGVYIDVFPMDGIGDTMEEARKNFRPLALRHHFMASAILAPREGRKWYKNLAVSLIGAIPDALLDRKKLVQRFDAACAARDYDSCRIVGVLVNSQDYRWLLPKEWYGEPAIYDFEGMKVCGPANYEAYLHAGYGDWRQLPPPEKRVSLHNRLYLDMHSSYLEKDRQS